MRNFCIAASLLLAPVAFGNSSPDPRLLETTFKNLNRASTLLMKGSRAEGQAYLDLAQARVPLRVALSESEMGASDAVMIEAVKAACNIWEKSLQGRTSIKFVTTPDANVRVRCADLSGGFMHVNGNATWIKRVLETSPGQFRGLLSGDIAIARTDAFGRKCEVAQLTYVVAHELGHILGLADTNKAGDLMGPAHLAQPAAVPSLDDLSAINCVGANVGSGACTCPNCVALASSLCGVLVR